MGLSSTYRLCLSAGSGTPPVSSASPGRRRTFGELGHQLDALRLAARQRRAGLAQGQVAEADVPQQLQRWAIAGCAEKKSTASSTGIASTSATVLSFQRTDSVSG